MVKNLLEEFTEVKRKLQAIENEIRCFGFGQEDRDLTEDWTDLYSFDVSEDDCLVDK